jgi:hypothetical protein
MNNPLVISFNGPDNVGKTTHINLLRNSLQERVLIYPSIRFKQELTPKQFEQWWFFDSSSVELTRETFLACTDLEKHIAVSEKILLLDRGIIMFEATCIASTMIKDKKNYNDARDLVQEIKNSILPNEIVDYRILLLHGEYPIDSVLITLEREGCFSHMYKLYQHMLIKVLHNQIKEEKYDCIVNCQRGSIDEIQNKIKEHSLNFIHSSM